MLRLWRSPGSDSKSDGSSDNDESDAKEPLLLLSTFVSLSLPWLFAVVWRIKLVDRASVLPTDADMLYVRSRTDADMLYVRSRTPFPTSTAVPMTLERKSTGLRCPTPRMQE